MEYQKTINLSDNTPNQQSRFRKKSWVEINMTHVEQILLNLIFFFFTNIHSSQDSKGREREYLFNSSQQVPPA